MAKHFIALGLALQLTMIPTLMRAQSTVDIDFTGDGVINFFDFVEFVVGFGNSDLTVDLDGNGDVNFLDFVVFAIEFGGNTEPPKETATFEVTFESAWSAETHPDNFPSSSAHFSALIGATHNSEVIFWQAGGLATAGIKDMAEFGATGLLTTEVNTAIDAGTAELRLSGSGLGESPGSVSLTFEISESHPRVTLVSMIAPSPDWFVGVSGINLFAAGAFLDFLAVDLHAYDAGTDSGVTYTSEDSVTDPPQGISRIQSSPFGSGTLRLGTFTFVRQ